MFVKNFEQVGILATFSLNLNSFLGASHIIGDQGIIFTQIHIIRIANSLKKRIL